MGDAIESARTEIPNPEVVARSPDCGATGRANRGAPNSLRELGYGFNENGMLYELESGDLYSFDELSCTDQQSAHFGVVLCAVDHEVRRMLVEGRSMKEPRANSEVGGHNLYVSEDAETNTTGLVVLVGGFGAAGQWDPRLVMSDGLEAGSQLSFISKCQDNRWAVAVLDTSCLCGVEERLEETEEPKAEPEEVFEDPLSLDALSQPYLQRQIIDTRYCDCDEKCIRRCSSDCLQRALSAWRDRILQLPSSKIALVAHQCGGFLVDNILRSEVCCERVKAVCLSDWTLTSARNSEWWRRAARIARHWVPSGRPCGAAEKTRYGIRCLSAGVRDPRKVPASSADDMVRFIRERFDSDH